MSKLTEKQELFCQEYVKDFNATRAYMRAGFSINYGSASVESCRMLGKPNIKKRLDELRKELKERNSDLVNQIVERYRRIAFTPVTQILGEKNIDVEDLKKGKTFYIKTFEEIPEEVHDIIKAIYPTANGLRVELHDPMAAMDALRKMHGLDAPTKTELTGKNGEDLNINIVVK